MNTTNTHYVNNKDLHIAMCAYITSCKEAELAGNDFPRVPNYIASSILKISTRMAGKHNYFNNRHYDEEMIMDGVETCLRYIRNFNPEKSNNPFSYFTQIIVNAFNRRIEKEKKEDYVKHKYTQHSAVLHGVEGSETVDGDDNPQPTGGNESVSDFINSFETHMEKKKAKRKKATSDKKTLLEQLGEELDEEIFTEEE